jgi:Protein of unknown function (DUF3379)
VNCAEFRRQVGASPLEMTAEQDAHRAECPDCAAYAAQLVALEPRLRAAFAIPVPPAAPQRRRDFSLPVGIAAAALLAATLAAILFGFYPRPSLAAAVTAHAQLEPDQWAGHDPVGQAALDAILSRSGVALSPGGPTVTYANSCWFRGRYVPHLVVQTDRGPVMVMVLPREHVSAASYFSEEGYRGVLVPAPKGALAVLTPGSADVAAVAAAVAERVHYLN